MRQRTCTRRRSMRLAYIQNRYVAEAGGRGVHTLGCNVGQLVSWLQVIRVIMFFFCYGFYLDVHMHCCSAERLLRGEQGTTTCDQCRAAI